MSEINNDPEYLNHNTNKDLEDMKAEKVPVIPKTETTQNQAEILLDVKKSLNNSSLESVVNKNNCNENDDNSVIETNLLERLYLIKTMKEENIGIKYGLLIGLIKVNQIASKEIVDAVLHLLVNGKFDMEQNFIIHSSQCVVHMLHVIQAVDNSLKAELLRVFNEVLRKSKCNLIMTMDTNFIETILEMLENDEDYQCSTTVNDLLIELLGIVASFSVSVKELKLIFKMLKGSPNSCWPAHSVDLLNVLLQMPRRSGPDEFFNFPGSLSSAIAIPPISKWPYQNGWTFNCWIHLDPASTVKIDHDKPYLYCFRTSKGLGYSGHFVGTNLVITTMKMKDKGLQHCIKFNFQPRKWHMISIVYVYNRWTRSEIRCYVDGELISHIEMAWQINVNETFDRCFIGASPDQKSETLLTGQISSIYGFTESLSSHQIAAIYSLGPSYKGHFKFEAECPQNLSETQRKLAFEGKLSGSLMFAYNPVACDRQLCLNQAPKRNNSVFAHSSHALMTGNVRPVLTHSIYSTLHSLGEIRILYPLFGQLDYKYVMADKSISTTIVKNIGARLINLLFELLRGSPSIRHQLVQSKGILLISHFISCSNLYQQLNSEFLESIIKLCVSLSRLHIEHLSKKQISPQFVDQIAAVSTGPKFQYAPVGNSNLRSITNGNATSSTDYKASVPPGSSHSLELVKHLYDYILSNTGLWIQAAPEVQLKLYEFLSTDFLSDGVIFNKTRCINAVLQCLHSIKYYYWLVNPRDRSGIVSKIPENAPPLTTEQITSIRSSIFQFIKNLMLKCHQGVLEEEMQGFLNFLTVVNEDDNIRHVLVFCVTLMSEQPSTMVPAFDHKHGIKVVFKLLGSQDEIVRIMALKLLGFYLQRSTYKRKQDSMVPHNLFTLIGERLLVYSPYLTIAMYNTLYEILTEKMTLKISTTQHNTPDKTHHLENPSLLKVIAHLIRQSQVTKELIQVRKMFLTDLNQLCSNSKENRRTVLQMSVWQDWLFMLAPLSPQTSDQEKMLDAVLNLVRQLLHHAIKFEYGGWRVWIDTLAILHSNVSYHEFRRDMRKVFEKYEHKRSDHSIDSNFQRHNATNTTVSGASSSSDYRLSNEFSEDQRKSELSCSKSVDLSESVARMIVDDIVETACDSVVDSSAQNVRSENQIFSPGPRSLPFRIPAFAWSNLHQRLLHDLLFSIENDLQIWKRSNNRNIVEFVNATENQIYIINLVHLITMLSDNLITCCGGLLPLLAAATSPAGDVDMLESGNGMTMPQAVCFLLRIMNIADIVVFASSLNFAELEQEKTMSNGGILRQCLRLVCTCAVRNSLENRFRDLHYQFFNDTSLFEVQSCNEESKFDDSLPQDPMQVLLKGLRPRCEDAQINEMLLQNYPVSDPEVLLQEMDINRLRAVVYRDVEEPKQAQFLALSIVYFLSVLMVSRYRDLLEPSPAYDSYSLESSVNNNKMVELDRDIVEKINHEKPDICETVLEEDEEKVDVENEENEEMEENVSEEFRNNLEEEDDDFDDDIYARKISFESDGRKSRISGNLSNESQKSENENLSTENVSRKSDEVNKLKVQQIASIHIDNKEDNCPSQFHKFMDSVPQFPKHGETSNYKSEITDKDDEEYPKSNFPSSANLTKRLEQALGGTAPLIREIFLDFSSYLSRTLIGSHGQELVSSGLVTLRQSTSVVEMVMLLCSQEWQNSLQKHAGLAFIELVNEGRLLAHASLDHTVRVSNEAHFILSRMHAEDVQKHSEFTRLCAIVYQERQAEEKLCEQLIASARTRDEELANRLKTRVESLVSSSHGIWAAEQNERAEFYRLDYWEDDSRRRRRFVINPCGNPHTEAILLASSMSEDCSPPLNNKNENEIFKCNLNDLNLKSKLIEGVSINDITITTESGYGVTDEELLDAEKSESRHNEDNQLEGDLDSEQDLSESFYKNSENKDTVVQPKNLDEGGRSLPNVQHKVSDSESSVSNFTRSINIDITGPVFLSTPAILLAPGVNVHGNVSITKSELYFEMDSANQSNIGLDNKVLCYMHHLHGKWHFSEIRAIFSRKFLHKNIALEIFVANRMAVMFAFPNQETVKKVVYALPQVGIGIKYCVSQHRKSSLASPRQIFKLSNMTKRWQQREISNFDYLMYLNTIAGRTYNDLNQYPIFPWVLANYESDTIDLSSPSNYRDLSCPIGALNPSRKKFFDNRFKNWDDDSQSAFHYGTHYSTAAFVLNYLIRIEPFTTLFLNLQGGKFDHADRTFHSIAQTWKNCQRDTSDVKELIPEYFYLPEMFSNTNRYRFGKSEDGNVVDDVILPKWAKTPEDFVRINRQRAQSPEVNVNDIGFLHSLSKRCQKTIRNSLDELLAVLQAEFWSAKEEILTSLFSTKSCTINQIIDSRGTAALESELVSCQLHLWIDLIFGYKQRGPEAVRAMNVFCYLTYEGSVNWDQVKDPMLKQALEDQIRSFGQTPSQLLIEPHPPRNSALHISPLMFTPLHTDLLMMLKFISNSPIVWMTANVHPQSPLSAVLTISANYIYGVNKWNHSAAATQTSSSLTGALSMTTSPSQSFQGNTNQSSLTNYRLPNMDSHSDKQHNYVSSNVQLPLSMDPLLAQASSLSKRSLGDGFDLCMQPHNMQFTCTPDNRVIFAGGFWDKSFRIFSVETGKLLQVVYGHFGVVVCIARSECGFNQDCYIVTGSTDCTIMLWVWSNRQHALLGDFNCRESAQPRMTITGYQAEIVCVQISGELGIIVSASKDSRCLIHTLQGELLRTLLLSSCHIDPFRLSISREGYILIVAKPSFVILYTINGKPLGHLLNSDENMPLKMNIDIDSKNKNYQLTAVSAMTLSKEGDYVILASDDGYVRVRRCHNLELVHSYPRCDAAITSLAITTDQRYILVGLCNGTIVIFNVDFNKWHHEYRDRYPAL